MFNLPTRRERRYRLKEKCFSKGFSVSISKHRGSILGENHNLIIPTRGEGQEVIIRWSLHCRDADGNIDHKRQDADPQGWTG